MQYTISKASISEIPTLVAYVMDTRRQLFPMIDHDRLPADLAHFRGVYIESTDACFLVAKDKEGNIIGTIGMLPYDFRIKTLELGRDKVHEIVKLFVDPDWRKKGMGKCLYASVKAFAIKAGVDFLYLHTHPFMEGALQFWQKQGFRLIQQDKTPVFKTLHLVDDLSREILVPAYGQKTKELIVASE